MLNSYITYSLSAYTYTSQQSLQKTGFQTVDKFDSACVGIPMLLCNGLFSLSNIFLLKRKHCILSDFRDFYW